MEKISVLIPEEDVEKRIQEIADELTARYKAIDDGKPIVVIGILKGSVMFMTELIKRVKLPLELDFMVCSSYGDDTVSSGKLKIKKDLDSPIEGKHVLLVEDIVDTGRTLQSLIKYLGGQNPQSLTLCSLLDKPSRRVCDVKADYTGFEIPDVFVVGYGLDYAQRYRNLPYIGVLSFE